VTTTGSEPPGPLPPHPQSPAEPVSPEPPAGPEPASPEPTATPEPASAEAPPEPSHKASLVLALLLLAAVVAAEILAAVLLRPGRMAHADTAVLAEPGVSRMLQGVAVDPRELAQVARQQHQPAPLVFLALALLDGLVLIGGLALAVPQLRPASAERPPRRLSAFIPSLAVLLAGVAVVVTAIARLRLLAAVDLSPPYGTLDYLLTYGQFRRRAVLIALAVLVAVKLVAFAIFGRRSPRAALRRGVPALVVTSMAAMVVAAACIAQASSSTGNLADAFAAAVVALTAIVWSAVIVSGSVRRLG